ncbi:MAG TPA: bifunctional DNA-binding transcriptional regulator/O6-methylguanine-DNA methyltransferase Ada [Thermoanaerobaculia bacterium]
MTDINSDTAWNAVLQRDRAFDGRFVLAVTSTRIYCRPSCPARKPRRENVRFYASNAEAEQAGFRACMRCLPTETPLAERVRAVLDERTDEKVTLDDLARAVNASPHHLQRAFKRQFGLSPKEYLGARRAERLKQQLQEGKDVTTATYEAGYGSSSRLYSQANARLGMTPATYRKRGRGMHIRFTTVTTDLGELLVGMTERGVCAVYLSDDAQELERTLHEEFANATIERADLGEAIAKIVRQLEEHAPTIDLPVDVQATAFQLRVWDALRKIPYGETRTYAEVAEAIGEPKAVRAVASACAKNQVAVVIPCHRVVRGDGTSGGYRWGSERKRKLLERERM